MKHLVFVVEGVPVVVMFTATAKVSHRHLADALEPLMGKPRSAGFVTLIPAPPDGRPPHVLAQAWGRSDSLNLGVHERDAGLIQAAANEAEL